ncbi:polymer-forming cytoskeletal-domain-containing protein [Pelagophyceae sp. CCMP2097]|nr:polymer-forming cytoskeletal-domain-containing protein [Pelagophyceae sp. CCMP2097]|mmetsp:Transcript_6033/g.19245  ORF Transcript_6033/g.19245 Transcript_6033/m.19245 type:complete len:178 (-) Transcript_6033:155-688(-)
MLPPIQPHAPGAKEGGPPVPARRMREKPPHRAADDDDSNPERTDDHGEYDWHKPSTANSEHFADPPDVTISKGVSMKGELSFPKLLRVEGKFSGSLKCGGDIIVALGGILESDVRSETGYVLVEGKLVGNVAARRIQIAETGFVYGDITCNSFIIAPGAIVIGACQVRPEPPEKNIG